MRLPIVTPTELVRRVEQTYDRLEQLVGLLPRVGVMLTQMEELVRRATLLVGEVDGTQKRARAVVARAETVTGAAEVLVGRAAAATGEVEGLLGEVEPLMRKAEPILRRLIDSTSPEEVDAVIALIDSLPGIVGKIDTDIIPILDTLSTVAPDIRDLLDVSRELNEIMGAVPGLGRIKRRVEAQQAEQDAAAYTADEDVSSAPARRRQDS